MEALDGDDVDGGGDKGEVAGRSSRSSSEKNRGEWWRTKGSVAFLFVDSGRRKEWRMRQEERRERYGHLVVVAVHRSYL
ncbi:unnamed protein product [Linum trigynum]|uniref:Uncharacterized protein n=1 Tax=Linum trigynum TaxID=586398 RepID=A0AAV2E855_9ROSI